MFNNSVTTNQKNMSKDLKIGLYLEDGLMKHYIGELKHIGDIYKLVTNILKVLNVMQTKSFIKLLVETTRSGEKKSQVLHHFTDTDMFNLDRKHMSAILFNFYETISENSLLNEERSEELYYIIKEYLKESGITSNVTSKTECLYLASLLLKENTINKHSEKKVLLQDNNGQKSIEDKITAQILNTEMKTDLKGVEITKLLENYRIVPLFNVFSDVLFPKLKSNSGSSNGKLKKLYDSNVLLDTRFYPYNGEKIFKSAGFQYYIIESPSKIVTFRSTDKYQTVKTILPPHYHLVTKKLESISKTSIYFEDNLKYPLIIKRSHILTKKTQVPPLLLEDYLEMQALLMENSNVSLYGIVCYATMNDDKPFQIYLVSKLMTFKKNAHRILNTALKMGDLDGKEYTDAIQKKTKKLNGYIKLHNKVLLFQ